MWRVTFLRSSAKKAGDSKNRQACTAAAAVSAVLAVALFAGPGRATAAPSSFIGPFNTVQTLASTVPKNGDVNPYGVAVAPATTGRLVAGDVLVSNFNNHRNLQGTGSTIVEVSPTTGTVTLFADLAPNKLPGSCPGGLGMTTALVALSSGWVIVGSLPTKNGTSASMQAGCLLVIDPSGRPVETIAGGPINGPWDMTALDAGSTATLFVTNVLNGTVAASPNVVNGGTVVRIGLSLPNTGRPAVTSETVIASMFPERTDPAALVVGPTGLGLGSDGTLYVADSVANRIAAIGDALTTPKAPTTVSAGGLINDPLGLTIAPNGDILSTNGGDGNLVETTPAGQQVAVKMLDTSPAPPGPNGNGTLFGLTAVPDGSGVYFVDDGTNTLNLLH
jgi:sugar lactone lactonase YvrE